MSTATAVADRRITPGRVSPSGSLVEEHAALLENVRRRAAAAGALLSAHVWPQAEIATLARYLRTRVLRQASDEEALLYPRGASAPLAELSDDHVLLHELAGRLERIDARHSTPADLRALVDQVLEVLTRHLAAEQAVLAALPDLRAHTDEPVCIDLSADHPRAAIDVSLERLLRLRPGERAVVRGRDTAALQEVCRLVRRFDQAGDGSGFGLEFDPGAGLLRVSRRENA